MDLDSAVFLLCYLQNLIWPASSEVGRSLRVRLWGPNHSLPDEQLAVAPWRKPSHHFHLQDSRRCGLESVATKSGKDEMAARAIDAAMGGAKT